MAKRVGKFRYKTGNKIYGEVQNIMDVMFALQQMGKELDHHKIKEIIRYESTRIINDARAKAPTQDIKNAIGFIEKNEDKFPTTVLIGPRYYSGYKGQLAHTFEYGTAPRYTERGYYRGFITARPFMRPAFDTNQSKVVTNISRKILKLATDKLK